MLESRPVAAVVCSKVVCRRPSSPIQFGSAVEVGLLELGQLPVALDLGDDLVLVADRLQDARVRRVAGLAAALAGELKLVEEDDAELLWRADDELLAGQLPDVALELCDVGADAGRDGLELFRVELDPGLLGLPEDADERELDLVEQALQASLLDLRSLPVGELVDQDGGGGEVVAGVGGDPALLGQLVERVAAAGRVQQVAADRGVEHEVRRDLGERLGVVGDDLAVAGGLDDQGGIVGLPREREAPPA